MKKNLALVVAAGFAVIAGVGVGYTLIKDPEIMNQMKEKATGLIKSSRQKIDGMSEDVALKTAQLTNNPQINQDWVNSQWSSLGL